MIEPVTLYDSTTITNGNSALLRSERMTPPGNRPMLVRDILFTLSVAWQSAVEMQLGALVRARVRVGRFDFSNTGIPIWLYGPVQDMFLEVLETSTVGGGNLVLDGSGNGAHFSRYRWVLPKPMYIPPGSAIMASFSRDDSVASLPFAGTVAITVRMSVRGLLLQNRMPTTHVPFVGAYVPVSGQMMTREDDMRNTLDKTVEVHRLVGRLASSNATYLRDALGAQGYLAATTEDFRYKMRLKASDGIDITDGGRAGTTSNLIPMCSIFPAQSRAWTFKKKLKPREQILAQFERAPAVAAWPMVSYIGSREERVE